MSGRDWIFPSDQNSCRLEKWNQIHFISGIPSSNHLCYYFLVGMKLFLDAWLSIQKQGSFQPHSSRKHKRRIKGSGISVWRLDCYDRTTGFLQKKSEWLVLVMTATEMHLIGVVLFFFRTTRCEVKAVSTFQGWMLLLMCCCCCCCLLVAAAVFVANNVPNKLIWTTCRISTSEHRAE